MDELIKALRCSCKVPNKDLDCTGCKYRCLEEVDDKIPVPADTEIYGVKYWEYCDTERMALDAADMLESLKSK